MSQALEADRAPAGHGRDAADPGDIPPSGWRDVVFRLRRRIAENHLSITAAGVAFYALIATFPGLLALLATYGLVFGPQQIAAQIAFLQRQLEPEAAHLLAYLLRGLAESDRSGAGFGLAGSALITLWGASLGLRALMRALNVAYGEEEKRSLPGRLGVALLLTLGALCAACCIAAVLLGVPVVSQWRPLEPALERLLFHARWPVVALIFWLSLLVLYLHGPSRAPARWSWVCWGALLATALWLAGTGVIAWYVAGSPGYHRAYGGLGIVVLVLAWFLLSAFCVLLGAEVNAELERQTAVDTTAGAEKPAGTRGAVVADTVGEVAQPR